MIAVLVTLGLVPFAVWVVLPAVADALMALSGRKVRRRPPERPQRLCFVIPAHDEELLIKRTIESLLRLDYPHELVHVVVIADNCSDGTAQAARIAGVEVLEREDAANRGKGHALAWAWQHLSEKDHDSFIIVDADTVVDRHLARDLAAIGDLRDIAVQCYDDMSNEDESPLTRMAGVLTRNRYRIAYPLKERAGLAAPLTGDGTALGWEVLRRSGLTTRTITEGWELYARYTLDGTPCEYLSSARIYAQEARSLQQSGTQRARWTAGRLAVLKMYLRPILVTPRIRLLQRLDLLAELSNLGPITRATIGVLGTALSLFAPMPWRLVLIACFAMGILQPLAYSAISLIRHEERGAALRAFTHLPRYVAWRLGVALGVAGMSGHKEWVRTARHQETPGTY